MMVENYFDKKKMKKKKITLIYQDVEIYIL